MGGEGWDPSPCGSGECHKVLPEHCSIVVSAPGSPLVGVPGVQSGRLGARWATVGRCPQGVDVGAEFALRVETSQCVIRPITPNPRGPSASSGNWPPVECPLCCLSRAGSPGSTQGGGNAPEGLERFPGKIQQGRDSLWGQLPLVAPGQDWGCLRLSHCAVPGLGVWGCCSAPTAPGTPHQ